MNDELERSLAAYRREVRPSGARRSSLEAAVFSGAPVAGTAAASTLTTLVGFGVGAGLGALALVGLLAVRSPQAPPRLPSGGELNPVESREVPTPPPSESEPEEVPSPTTASPEPIEARSLRPVPARSPRRRATKPASPEHSALEDLRMLRDAERKLKRDPAGALTLLRTHASRYPKSALSLERSALEVIALCASGRIAEGRAARARFLATAAQSPYVRRVREACLPVD